MPDDMDFHTHAQDDRDIINVERDTPAKTKKKTTTKRDSKEKGQVNVNLPIELLKQLKLAAIDRDETVSDVVEYYISTAKRLPSYELRKAG